MVLDFNTSLFFEENYPGAADLACALRSGDIDATKQVLHRHPELLDLIDIQWLAVWAHPVALDYVLKAGLAARIDEFKWGLCPLFRAASSGSIESVRVLLENGADVNNHGEPWDTALKECVGTAPLELVNLLLDAGADPTLMGCYGHTAILEAEERFKEKGDAESAAILQAVKKVASKFRHTKKC